MTPLATAYWLLFCVFLIFQHPANTALALTGEGITDGQRIKGNGVAGACADWEDYDGIDCVCASDKSTRCTQDEGMVCDDKGGHYKSKCYFALQTCNQNVSLDSEISSCGACEILKLIGGKDAPQSATRAEFRRVGSDVGLSTRYQSVTDKTIEIFFYNETGTWAIGERNATGTFVAMMQVLNGSYPEDANPGMLVPVQNGTYFSWELDSTFRLECVDESENALKGRREKRFIFALIFAIIAIVSVAVVTVKVVQSLKGCLYYPSVCSLRDDIRHRLLPDVRAQKQRFLSTFGNPSQFSSAVDKIHSQLLDIKNGITKIPELHTTLNISLSNMVNADFGVVLPNLTSVLSFYDEWLESVAKAARLEFDLLPLGIVMAMPMLAITTASYMALAASGIGVVLTFGFAIVDMVSSALEERRVRDQLIQKRNSLLSARNNLNSAFSQMNKFQLQFCQYIVRFLYAFSSKGKLYDKTLMSLYNFISKTYGHSASRCNYQVIRSKTTHANLHQLTNVFLPPVLSTLTNNVESLKRKIIEVKETNAFLDEVKNKIRQNTEPADIFRFIKTHKPVLTKKFFNNFFDLLKFISKSVYPDKSCFWGYDLDSIKRGGTTFQNYMEVPICNSDEIALMVTTIRKGAQNQDILCKISRQVEGPVFRSRYHVIRFIADFVFPDENCYWGYDLSVIRNSPYSKEINDAKVDSQLLGTLRKIEASGMTSLARQILQEQHAISSQSWQTFLLCHAWQNQNAIEKLKCATKSSAGSCFPVSSLKYQSC